LFHQQNNNTIFTDPLQFTYPTDCSARHTELIMRADAATGVMKCMNSQHTSILNIS